MIIAWIRKKLAIRSSKKLVRTVRGIIRKKGRFMAPREADHAEVRILACEEAIKRGSLHEIRASRKALRIFFEDNLRSYGKSALRQNVEAIVIAVALALAIRAFVVQPFKIPSGSMLPTLLVGDHILINKFVYGTRIPFTNKIFFPFSMVDRGDIIVFKLSEDNTTDFPMPGKGAFYVKRAVGIAGDEIDISGRDVLINGRAVDQVYTGNYEYPDQKFFSVADKYEQSLSGKDFSVIYKKGSSSTTSGKMSFPLVVPKGRVFVMGDNRDNSYDSRFWGFVPVENVYGKAFMIHWSWNLSNPGFADKVRWHRIFSGIE
jgi:signal peptidase I